MKLAEALLELTGDVKFADCIERSYYNAYVGAFNTHRVPFSEKKQKDVPQVLPFDSYSPLVSNTRGKKVGGYGIFSDRTFYGCCACIGAAGGGVIPQFSLMRSRHGFVLNYYEKGTISTLTPNFGNIKLTLDTKYPYDGEIKLEIELDKAESFSLALRIPAWCDKATITSDGVTNTYNSGYAVLTREWNNGDIVEIELSMLIKRILPPMGADNEDTFVGYMRGPIVLAADKRVTDPDAVLDIKCNENGIVAGVFAYCTEIPEHKFCCEVELSSGEKVRLIDYASAGKTWGEDSRMAAWLRRK